MTEVLTAEQMRAVERAAIDSGAVTGLELMERAGAGVVEAILAEWPDIEAGARRAVVLCGPGNNGGDGFVVARLLKARGWDVEVHFLGTAETLSEDARTCWTRWTAVGSVQSLTAATWEDRPFPGRCDLVIDALFGTGLKRPVGLPLRALEAEPALGQTHRTVAVDLPSGLCSDSGRIIGHESDVLSADLTVTFHRSKLGHYLGDGPAYSGWVTVADIGLKGGGDASVTQLQRASGGLDKAGGHKFHHGHALVLSGGVGRGGAARMAARGALRIGAGLVTVGCPPAALIENAAQLDAVMLRSLRDPDALAEMLEDDRLNALCLGPGLGMGEREAGLVRAALSGRRATVLDGDALTLISQDDALRDLLHPRCLLTPHDGEFKRLFPEIHDRLTAPATTGPAWSKIDATRAAAKAAGCTVLLKGPDTVIAVPDGTVRIAAAVYDRAVPWLATAGAGDTLAGFATGLMARGWGPLDAGATAAWIHAECALEFGPGLIAEDLADTLPLVLRKLL